MFLGVITRVQAEADEKSVDHLQRSVDQDVEDILEFRDSLERQRRNAGKDDPENGIEASQDAQSSQHDQQDVSENNRSHRQDTLRGGLDTFIETVGEEVEKLEESKQANPLEVNDSHVGENLCA